eukprot:31401-Pelagococcus_subviridis.AAC.2
MASGGARGGPHATPGARGRFAATEGLYRGGSSSFVTRSLAFSTLFDRARRAPSHDARTSCGAASDAPFASANRSAFPPKRSRGPSNALRASEAEASLRDKVDASSSSSSSSSAGGSATRTVSASLARLLRVSSSASAAAVAAHEGPSPIGGGTDCWRTTSRAFDASTPRDSAPTSALKRMSSSRGSGSDDDASSPSRSIASFSSSRSVPAVAGGGGERSASVVVGVDSARARAPRVRSARVDAPRATGSGFGPVVDFVPFRSLRQRRRRLNGRKIMCDDREGSRRPRGARAPHARDERRRVVGAEHAPV